MSGLKVGEIDIGDQVLDNEYKIKLLFKMLQKLLDKNPNLKGITEDELKQMKKDVEDELQKRYPKSGITVK